MAKKDEDEYREAVSKHLINTRSDIKTHKDALNLHQSSLLDHTNQLSDHEDLLLGHQGTLDVHDATLITHDGWLDWHQEQITALDGRVDHIEADQHYAVAIGWDTTNSKMWMFVIGTNHALYRNNNNTAWYQMHAGPFASGPECVYINPNFWISILGADHIVYRISINATTGAIGALQSWGGTGR